MTNLAAFTFRWPRMEKPYSPPHPNIPVRWRAAADTPALRLLLKSVIDVFDQREWLN